MSNSRVLIGGLNAPNLLKQLGILAVALVCDEGSGCDIRAFEGIIKKSAFQIFKGVKR
jgi:hypothetical protein